MSYIIAISNQKGGVGKSTTSQCLAQGLRLHKNSYKTLLIDLDPQGNTSYSVGADINKPTAYDLLTNKSSINEVIQKLSEGVDIIPSSDNLSNLNVELNETGKEYRLKEKLSSIEKDYDYIILDTGPDLGILTVNALTSCHAVIIPSQADIYNLQGIGKLYNTIQAVKKYSNPSIQIQGILLTKHHTRTILNRDLEELIEDTATQLNTRVYDTFIRESVVVREAQAKKINLFSYAPTSNPAKDYLSFVDEVIKRSEANE